MDKNIRIRAIFVTLGLTFIPLLIILILPELVYVPFINIFMIAMLYVYLSPLVLIKLVTGVEYLTVNDSVVSFQNNGVWVAIICWLVILSFISYFIIRQPGLTQIQQERFHLNISRLGKWIFGGLIVLLLAYGVILYLVLGR